MTATNACHVGVARSLTRGCSQRLIQKGSARSDAVLIVGSGETNRQQRSGCRPENTFAFVKRNKVGFVVHLHPFATRELHLGDQALNERPAYAAPPMIRIDDCVEQEGVSATVPAGVDEPDKCASRESSHPRQAVSLQARTHGWRSRLGCYTHGHASQ